MHHCIGSFYLFQYPGHLKFWPFLTTSSSIESIFHSPSFPWTLPDFLPFCNEELKYLCGCSLSLITLQHFLICWMAWYKTAYHIFKTWQNHTLEVLTTCPDCNHFILLLSLTLIFQIILPLSQSFHLNCYLIVKFCPWGTISYHLLYGHLLQKQQMNCLEWVGLAVPVYFKWAPWQLYHFKVFNL